MSIGMKITVAIALLSIAMVVIGCSSNQVATQDQTSSQTQGQRGQSEQGDSNMQNGYGNIDSAQAKELIDTDKSLQIIDVRESFEYRMGRIPGSKLIPVGQLESRLGEIDKSKPVLVYCATGSRSRSAAQMLVQAGYSKVYNLVSGIVAWNYAIEK